MASKTRRERGEGSIYQRADGLFAASMELGPSIDGRRRRKVVYGKSRTEVREKLQAARRKADQDKASAGVTPTVSRWAETYYARCEQDGTLALSTVKGYRQKLRTIIEPVVGNVRLDKLTVQHVRKVHAFAVADGRSATNKTHAHVILSGLLSAAVEDELIGENVCKRMKTPRPSHYAGTALTVEESTRLLHWAEGKPWFDLRVSLALLAGVRSGEALGLTRGVVNLEAGTINIEWQLQRVAPGAKPAETRPARHVDGNYWLLEPKAKASRRNVPMLPRLYDLMAARLAEMPADPWALVFTAERGGPMSHERDWARWRQALDGAGVRRVRRHDSRHTTATLLRAAGVQERVIQAIIGHTSATMTAHYSHLGPGETREAMLALGRHLAIEAR